MAVGEPVVGSTADVPQHLLAEMTLYYEEVRDINRRSMLYVKIVGVVVLGLCSYLFFGLRYYCDAIRQASEDNAQYVTAALADIMPVYAIIGILVTCLLFALNCFCICLYGRSRLHKFRYWRSVSILRERLHSSLGLLAEGRRAIPIQTGLEESPYSPFNGKVPRPYMRKHDRAAGVFLAVFALVLMVVPFLVFAMAWCMGQENLEKGVEACFRTAFVYSVPTLGIVMALAAYVVRDYCQRLLAAQFVSPECMDPELERRAAPRWERVGIGLFRFVVYAGLIGHGALSIILGSKWSGWSGSYWAGVIILFLVAVERTLTGVLRRWGIVCLYVIGLRFVARLFGPKRNPRTIAWLQWLHGEPKANLIWKQDQEDRLVRSKGGEPS